MNSLFYLKLALSNLKKNAKIQIPYLITCVVSIMVYYIMLSLSINPGIKNMIGADPLQWMLTFGSFLVGIFAIIFLFYTNSFLVKRRKKEFGLLNILGMEKKHIGIMMAYETLINTVVALLFGILFGILLDKAMYMVISSIFESPLELGFYVSSDVILKTCLFFIILFIVIYLHDLTTIRLSSAISLLHSQEFGEKEPKARWIMALLGVVCLIIGYTISVTTKQPLSAFGLFFVAVLFVVVGTYLLFIAGSIVLLKLLKKNKRYYYQTYHFISVSGMIYRMKQNAVGLANICILSTMVIVILSCTVSLWIGSSESLNERYPREILITNYEYDPNFFETGYAITDDLLEETGLERSQEYTYDFLYFSALRQDDFFNVDLSNARLSNLDGVCNLFFIPLDEYNYSHGRDVTLEEDEILICPNREDYTLDQLRIFDNTFTVKEHLTKFNGNGFMSANVASTYYVVVKDMSIIEEMDLKQKEVYGDHASNIRQYIAYDISGDKEDKLNYYQSLQERINNLNMSISLESRTDSRNSYISLFGGFLFIGIFLSILFLMATILIIYYKQMSEGYDDQERYDIMQKVGLDHKDVKRSIQSQILTVFFLPLVAATIHVIFAFPILSKLLMAFGNMDTFLLIKCTAGCIFVFSIVYILIYNITARLYYSMVKR